MIGFPGRIEAAEMVQFTEQFDVVVVGVGHAGCEVEAFARRPSRASEIPSAARDLAEHKIWN
jgi:hypothetical protein